MGGGGIINGTPTPEKAELRCGQHPGINDACTGGVPFIIPCAHRVDAQGCNDVFQSTTTIVGVYKVTSHTYFTVKTFKALIDLLASFSIT
jgi:hypothetical protein